MVKLSSTSAGPAGWRGFGKLPIEKLTLVAPMLRPTPHAPRWPTPRHTGEASAAEALWIASRALQSAGDDVAAAANSAG